MTGEITNVSEGATESAEVLQLITAAFPRKRLRWCRRSRVAAEKSKRMCLLVVVALVSAQRYGYPDLPEFERQTSLTCGQC